MAVERYFSYWISANQYEIGPSSGTPSDYQKLNAIRIYRYFRTWGWTLNAISAMIGNMMYESCINPATVYPKSSFPNGGATIADISNQYALSRTSPAYGLVQWVGLSSEEPIANQLVSYCYRHGYEWYTGEMQMARLYWEWDNEKKWHPKTLDGTYWTFHDFSGSTDTPEYLAYVFMRCYEDTESVTNIRRANARTWYNYLVTDPDPEALPIPGWVTGEQFAQYALAYNGQYMPYDQYDCIGYVNKVWQDIPAASGSLPSGTNTIWRSTKTYNTVSPKNQNPCPVLWYKDTLANCISRYNGIPTGTLLFHQIGEEGPPPIPSQYAGDGIGNFVHVGIYVGNNQVMQSGGRDSASIPGGGVHLSTYDASAWNYAAFVVWVNPITGSPGPGPGPGPVVPKLTPEKIITLWGEERKRACRRLLIIH